MRLGLGLGIIGHVLDESWNEVFVGLWEGSVRDSPKVKNGPELYIVGVGVMSVVGVVERVVDWNGGKKVG